MLDTFNKEMFRPLPQSDKLYPRNVNNLLEPDRIPRSLRKTVEQAARYKKRKTMPLLVLPQKRPRGFLMCHQSRGCRNYKSDDDEQETFTATEIAVARASSEAF